MNRQNLIENLEDVPESEKGRYVKVIETINYGPRYGNRDWSDIIEERILGYRRKTDSEIRTEKIYHMGCLTLGIGTGGFLIYMIGKIGKRIIENL